MQTIFINHREILTPDFFTVYHTADGNKYNRIENELNHNMFTEHINVIKIELYRNGTQTSHPTLKDVIYKDDYSGNTIAQYSFI
ncbi:hypothetical protein FC093_11340 [Ilyomonas limi]|uniref:Uncharacterized protein n=1 Tax=Ilyomonas limi TaxID=2575867 RepID=A0A4U3L0G4_9BACT|nr:hypothetical protein [Ilyomonas limi]TKK68222.1 hypothetical protein FC093_11340 [Ilyomonas limi]